MTANRWSRCGEIYRAYYLNGPIHEVSEMLSTNTVLLKNL